MPNVSAPKGFSTAQSSSLRIKKPDKFDAQQIAKDIYEAGEGRLGTDEERFQALLSGRTRNEVEAIDQAYQKYFGHDLKAAVEAEMSGFDREYALGLASGGFAPQTRLVAETLETASTPDAYRSLAKTIQKQQSDLKLYDETFSSGSFTGDLLNSPATLNRLRASAKIYLESLYNVATQQFNQKDYEAAKKTMLEALRYESAIIQITKSSLDRTLHRIDIAETITTTVLAVDLAIGAGALAIFTAGAAVPALSGAGLTGFSLTAAKFGLGVAAGTIFETEVRGGGFLMGEALQAALGNGFDGKRVLHETAIGARNGVIDSGLALLSVGLLSKSVVMRAALQRLGASESLAEFVTRRLADLTLGSVGGALRAAVARQSIVQGAFRGAVFSAALGMFFDATAWAYDGIHSHFSHHPDANPIAPEVAPKAETPVLADKATVAPAPVPVTPVPVATSPAAPVPVPKPPMTVERREEILQGLIAKLQSTGQTKVVTYDQLVEATRGSKVVVLGGYSGLGYQDTGALDQTLASIVSAHGDNTVYVIGGTSDGIGRAYETIPKLATELGLKNIKTAGIVSKNAAEYGVAPQDYVVFVDTTLNDWEVKVDGVSLMVDIAKKAAGKMVYLRGGGVAQAEINEALQRQVEVHLSTDSVLMPNAAIVAKKLAKDPKMVIDGTVGFLTEVNKYPTLELKQFLPPKN